MGTASPHDTLALLDDPATQELLRSTIPAGLASTWRDGTPRVVRNRFHWTGEEGVLGRPAAAPKIATLRERPRVAPPIDSSGRPPKVLLIRGTARSETVPGVAPEYAAARRSLGEERGDA